MIAATGFQINRPTVVFETIDKEVIIIEFDSGNYYSLDKAGADIWNFIDKGESPDDIIEKLIRLYKGNRQDMEIAVHQLIDELEKENLIVTKKIGNSGNSSNISEQFETDLETPLPVFEVPTLQKYSDMQELLLLDPIHEVDEKGWPVDKQEPDDNTNDER